MNKEVLDCDTGFKCMTSGSYKAFVTDSLAHLAIKEIFNPWKYPHRYSVTILLKGDMEIWQFFNLSLFWREFYATLNEVHNVVFW